MLRYQNVVPHERIKSFFIHERLPDDWATPTPSLGFLKTVQLGGVLRAEMDNIIAKENENDSQATAPLTPVQKVVLSKVVAGNSKLV